MNRFLFTCIAACTLLAVATPPADACHRCGIFGRGCRYVSYVAPAPVVVAPPTQQTTFNFVNSYPILPLGNSVYGYSLAAQSYALDPALVLDRSARLVELAISGGQKALAEHGATVQGALALGADIDRRTKNTLVALSAISANQQQAGASGAQSLSFKATITDGRLSVQRLDEPGSVGAASAFGLVQCAACHDGRGTKGTPLDFALDGQSAIAQARKDAAVLDVISGKMPPGQPLTNEQKAAVIGELCRLP